VAEAGHWRGGRGVAGEESDDERGAACSVLVGRSTGDRSKEAVEGAGWPVAAIRRTRGVRPTGLAFPRGRAPWPPQMRSGETRNVRAATSRLGRSCDGMGGGAT
jgi:hypothetical protein